VRALTAQRGFSSQPLFARFDLDDSTSILVHTVCRVMLKRLWHLQPVYSSSCSGMTGMAAVPPYDPYGMPLQSLPPQHYSDVHGDAVWAHPLLQPPGTLSGVIVVTTSSS
jgi:hypothetical protein